MVVSLPLFRFLHKPAMRAAIVAVLSIAFCAGSFSPRRAWTDDDALWRYAARVEPRAALHHHNVSNAYFRSGDVERGAYHRPLYGYLIHRYPELVQWDVIETTRALPLNERFIALPAEVQPDDPCPLIRVFTTKSKQHPPLYDYVQQHWPARYPQCVSPTEREP